MNLKQWFTECSAALADLGTFIPLVLGLIVLGGMNPTGLLFGFGVFAITTALLYRRPIPVQPMKAAAAMGIAGVIGPEVLVATGVLIGITLLILSRTQALEWMKGLIPRTVLYGLQLSLAVSLVVTVFTLGEVAILPLLLLVGLMIGSQFTQFKAISCLLVVGLGCYLFGDAAGLNFQQTQIALPGLVLPSFESFIQSMETAYLPQLALTLTNALILTTVVARDYFPDEPENLNEKKLAVSSGFANLLLAPFGAMPMCHGAGGLSAYYGSGSRTGWSIGIFGVMCILLALLFGKQATAVLTAVPYEVTATLILFAAWTLASPAKLVHLKLHCKVIIVAMVPIALWSGFMTALLAGIAMEMGRSKLKQSGIFSRF